MGQVYLAAAAIATAYVIGSLLGRRSRAEEVPVWRRTSFERWLLKFWP